VTRPVRIKRLVGVASDRVQRAVSNSSKAAANMGRMTLSQVEAQFKKLEQREDHVSRPLHVPPSPRRPLPRSASLRED